MKYRLAIGRDHHRSRARVCHVRDLSGVALYPREKGGPEYVLARERSKTLLSMRDVEYRDVTDILTGDAENINN